MNTQHTAGWFYYGASPTHPFEITELSGVVLAQTFPRSQTRQSAIKEAHANGHLFAASPLLLAVAEKVLYDLNGLNATARATDLEYKGSPLCETINQLVKMASEAVSKAKPC